MTKIKIEELDGCTVKVIDGKVTYRRIHQYIDGDMLERFNNGDRDAIRAVCATVAQRLSGPGLHDPELIAVLIEIFDFIGKGGEPNLAFEWGKEDRHRPPEDLEYRDWYLKITIQDLMISDNISFTAACNRVADAGTFGLKKSQIFELCKGLKIDTPLPEPAIKFPMPDPLEWHRKDSPD